MRLGVLPHAKRVAALNALTALAVLESKHMLRRQGSHERATRMCGAVAAFVQTVSSQLDDFTQRFPNGANASTTADAAGAVDKAAVADDEAAAHAIVEELCANLLELVPSEHTVEHDDSLVLQPLHVRRAQAHGTEGTRPRVAAVSRSGIGTEALHEQPARRCSAGRWLCVVRVCALHGASGVAR